MTVCELVAKRSFFPSADGVPPEKRAVELRRRVRGLGRQGSGSLRWPYRFGPVVPLPPVERYAFAALQPLSPAAAPTATPTAAAVKFAGVDPPYPVLHILGELGVGWNRSEQVSENGYGRKGRSKSVGFHNESRTASPCSLVDRSRLRKQGVPFPLHIIQFRYAKEWHRQGNTPNSEPGSRAGHSGGSFQVQRAGLPCRVDLPAGDRPQQRFPVGQHAETARISGVPHRTQGLHPRLGLVAPRASVRLGQHAHPGVPRAVEETGEPDQRDRSPGHTRGQARPVRGPRRRQSRDLRFGTDRRDGARSIAPPTARPCSPISIIRSCAASLEPRP